MTAPDLEVDAVVIGGGIGGLTAASYLARSGATVLLAEKAARLGGSSALSGGVLWTAPTLRDWRERCPQGIEELGRTLVEGLPGVLEWFRSLDIEVSAPVRAYDFAWGHPFDLHGYLRTAAALVESSGGYVRRSTAATGLSAHDGHASLVTLTDTDGRPFTVRAPAVVLATGGLQGDPEARSTYIHPRARGIAVRANPHSVGDGLRMAKQVGGGTYAFSTGFYGHLVCAPLARLTERDFDPLYLHFSHRCLLVNTDGERFTNERSGDQFNAQALVTQPDCTALVVFDDDVYRGAVITPNIEGNAAVDKFEIARDRGARVAVADTLPALAEQTAAWGFPADAVLRSVERFNAGQPVPESWTPPPRVSGVDQIDRPPFYAMQAAPAVTFAHAGVRVDRHGRVLRPDDSALPGLYACGVDIGGLYDRGYCGGLSLASVFGLACARHIAGRA